MQEILMTNFQREFYFPSQGSWSSDSKKKEAKKENLEARHRVARPSYYHVGSCLMVRNKGLRWFALRQGKPQSSTGYVMCYIPIKSLRSQGVVRSMKKAVAKALLKLSDCMCSS